jgi:AcrR family transcriptional regulator
MDTAPRKRSSDATREAIVAAAREVFVANGYDGTSIRKVAQKSGYSHGTMYLYFRDKDDLLSQLSEELFRLLLTRLRTLPRTLPPIARLRKALRIVLTFGLESPHHYHMMMSVIPPHLDASPRRFGTMATDVSGFLFDSVIRAAERDGISLEEPAVATEGLLALVHGAIELYRAGVMDAARAESVGMRAINLMLAGMYAGAPPCHTPELNDERLAR